MTDNYTPPSQDTEQREQARKERYMRQFWRQEEHFYRSGGLRLTAQARADLTAIENEYEPLFDAANRAIMDASTTKPDVTAFYKQAGNISPTLNPDAWKAAQQQATDAIKAWEANAPDEWKDAQRHLSTIIAEYDDKKGAVYLATYRQQYEALGSEPGNIVQLAKAHVDWLIEDQYKDYKAASETSLSMSAYDVVALGGDKWKLDATETRKRVLRALRDLHFRALGDNTQAIDEIKAYIDKAIKSSRYIAPEGTPGVHEKIVFKRAGALEEPYTADTSLDLIRTTFPLTHIAPIDKVSRKMFTGELTETLTDIGMERRGSKKAITTTVQLYFSPQLENLPAMALYDKAVYYAMCSVYKVGNRIMTDRMIYQAMTGNADANLSPKQAEGINQSITKFMYTGAKIDMTEELKARNIPGKMVFDENLLHAKRGEYNLNGTKTTAIEMLDTPLLLKIGESKNQIARLSMAAIATPVNKNEESIALQTYLLDRIYSMKGMQTDERRIAYKTVYGEIWGKEAEGKSRTQKKRLRGYMADMLTHWTKNVDADGGAIIKSFEEYIRGKTAQGVRINL